MRKTKKQKNKKIAFMPLLKMILKFMKPYLWMFILALLVTVIDTVSLLLVPNFVGDAIDIMIGQGNVNFDLLLTCVIKITVCAIIAFTGYYLSVLLANKISFSVMRDIKVATFKKLNSVPIKYIDSNSHGDIMSRVINDTQQITDGIITGFLIIFAGIVSILVTLIFMMLINVFIALIIMVLTPLSLGFAWFLAKKTHDTFVLQSQKNGAISGLSEEMISNQKLVKAFNYEERAEEAFDVINQELKIHGAKAMFASSMAGPSSRFINSIVYTLATLLGGLLCIYSPMFFSFWRVFSAGHFSSMLFYANLYTKPFNEITSVTTELQTAMAAAERIHEILAAEDEISDDHLPDINFTKGSMEARGVKFSYNPERPLITNFNIKVEHGQKIAIVGPTGCGKTTFINLLMRFYDVTGGEILISDTPITSVNRKSLRSCFGMVLQDSWLFKGTIRENIAYGKEDATEEEIIEAAKSARIHGYITRQEFGYDTVIDGDNISQGQKQLLCIARIMLTKPPMLIFDEATSNIDTRTELRIQEALAEMMQGRTSFIIAHRLSTIMDADKIIVMNQGDIIESGSHTELLEKGGFYATLYRSQFS